MGVDDLFPRDAGEPSAVHVLPPGQPLLFHCDQRQPGRVHCRRQLLCQRDARRAHRVVADRRVHRRVRWRAGGYHLAAVEDAEYEPVMLVIVHSCEPNVGFAGNAVLVAMRDISPGEERTTDYALFDDYDGIMHCRCGTPSCRATIGGQDWQRPDLQRKYGNYFSSYLLSYLLHRLARQPDRPGWVRPHPLMADMPVIASRPIGDQDLRGLRPGSGRPCPG
jgi:hypothetical protein